MDKIEEIIRKEAAKIRETTKRNIEDNVKAGEDRMDEYIKNLEEASKIVMPVNIVDVLANGGNIQVMKTDGEGLGIDVAFGGRHMYVKLTPDQKYRVVVIAEVLEE